MKPGAGYGGWLAASGGWAVSAVRLGGADGGVEGIAAF